MHDRPINYLLWHLARELIISAISRGNQNYRNICSSTQTADLSSGWWEEITFKTYSADLLFSWTTN